MKKITLLFALLISSIGFSQTPTGAAPTPPARNAGDVVSIFSQTSDESTKVYADIAANLNPNWGETSGQVTFPAFGSDRVMQIPAFNYQGTGAVQWLIGIPLMVVPMALFGLLNWLVGFEIAIATLIVLGIVGIVLHKQFMAMITQKYLDSKYKMIAAFGKDS